ncbi:hypothetical protein G9A89_002059 [Geosiphon pyriformis]|nr:hypothetical protein G9A89_002059 [Geosiphon pyriformis]
MENQQIASELHTSARKYYRLLCLQVARYLSYIGHTFEPYTTQNEILNLVKPTSTGFTILHFPKNGGKRVCPISKFTRVDGLYVAYVGHLQKELSDVKRFFSYYHHSPACDRLGVGVAFALPPSSSSSSSSTTTNHKDKKKAKLDSVFGNGERGALTLADLVTANWVAQKIELNYVDPLKEYLNVILDKENGEFMEVFVEIAEDDPISTEPTFEDVMTLWIAVVIWGIQLVTTGLVHRKTASRITDKLYTIMQK